MSCKKTLLSFCFSLFVWSAWAQADWSLLTLPRSNRYDDVFFVNDTMGWAANADRRIYRTMDGGQTWTLQFTAPGYLRSIEFANTKLGFCGSLDSALFRTEDGG